jgi:hypothetical protein
MNIEAKVDDGVHRRAAFLNQALSLNNNFPPYLS